MDLKKLQILGDDYSKHFKKVAKDIVMAEVTNTDDENKEVIAMFTARDMAIGAILKRKEYMLTGVTIGVLGTCLTIGVINKIKERRNTKKDEVGE